MLGGKIYEFPYCLDAASAIRDKLMHVFGRKTSIAMLTDSVSQFKVMVRSSRTTEKR